MLTHMPLLPRPRLLLLLMLLLSLRLFFAKQGKERKSTGYGTAAVMGSLAALKLWRGFKKHNSTLTV